MNESTLPSSLPRSLLWIVMGLSLACMSVGCAGSASAVRPDGLGAADAIGEVFVCTPDKLAGDLSPFTADWSDGERAALEAAMKRGVAVLSMTCEGPKVLKACMVGGDYSYSGISKKTKVVKMEDTGAVAANFGGGVFSPSLSAQLSQGRSLDLAYMLVGVESTTVPSISREQLKGRCDGATHFVFEAQLGAFALDTSERGQARAAADLLVGEMAAASDSSKSSRSTDGDPEACELASESDRDKTEGCAALLRVELMALDSGARPAQEEESKPETALRAVGCPEGFTWDGELCVPPESVPYALCDDFDTVGCKAQCEKGSLESCNRFAEALLFELSIAEALAESPELEYKERLAWAETLGPHLALLEPACKAELPAACTVVGHHWAAAELTGEKAVEYFGRACELGSPQACQAMVREGVFLPRDRKQGTLDTACRRGVARACALWVEEASSDLFESRSFDPGIAEMAGRACFGGFTYYCPVAAGLYQGEGECVQTMQYGRWTSGSAINLEVASDLCQSYTPLIDEDAFQAELLLNAGCDYGDAQSCSRLAESYGVFEIPELDLEGINWDELD